MNSFLHLEKTWITFGLAKQDIKQKSMREIGGFNMVPNWGSTVSMETSETSWSHFKQVS